MFDFTANCAAVWSDGTGFKSCCNTDFNTDFMQACSDGVMRPNCPDKMSLKRVVRFSKRGWKIDPSVLIAILEAVKSNDPKKHRTVYDAISGGKFNHYM